MGARAASSIRDYIFVKIEIMPNDMYVRGKHRKNIKRTGNLKINAAKDNILDNECTAIISKRTTSDPAFYQ